MKISDINIEFEKSVLSYDEAIKNISHCLVFYEKYCSEKIVEISKCVSFADTAPLFDELYEVQEKMCMLLFKRNMPIGSRLESLTREFDSLYDQNVRKYWYDRFKGGAKWPDIEN